MGAYLSFLLFFFKVPRFEAGGTPPRGGRGYVATLRTCGPSLMLPPAV